MIDLKSFRIQLGLRERRSLLVAGDLITGYLALAIALTFWALNAEWLGFSLEFFVQRVPPWFYFLPLIWPVLLVELYELHRAADWPKTCRSIGASALIGLALYSLVYISTNPNSMPRIGVAAFVVAVSLLTLLWRWFYIRIFTAPQFMRRVLLVGGGRAGETILQVINQSDSRPFELVGIIDDDPEKIGTQIHGAKVLAGSDQLLEIAAREGISEIMVAISGEMMGSTFQALLDAQERGHEITRMPVAYEELLGRVPIRLLEADWLLRSFVDDTRISAFYEIGKRLMDMIGGLVGVLVLLLILPFVGLATLLDDGWPIFYSQTRLGKGGRPYQIIKFRTMIKDAEADGTPQWAKEDDERATRVGKILRKTRLDEWPQFINVLRGEMSLVGPRSERPKLIEHFQNHVPFYRARLLVKPGITGWAQINFSYAASVEETITKLEYDLFYIKHRSLWLDLIILLRTPATMFGLRGQ
jgi:exopolysaccharide biosynthesis polyprenyl glycosylphosphotransferase